MTAHSHHEGHDHAGHSHGAHGHDGHGHGGHGHHHPPGDFGRAFAIGIALNLAYVAGEAAYGVIAHSLALLADAGHNLGDVLGLAASWAASLLSKRRPTRRYTYGLRGSSILASLANATILLLVTGGIAAEAVRRVLDPEPVAGGIVMVVAAVGIAVNGVTALLFVSGRKHDLNLRSAFMHMAADALVAFGVVLAGALIMATGWLWLDPVISLVVSVVILVGTWSLLRDSVILALDAVPPGIDQEAVRLHLHALPGVAEVHDLHIWGMSTTETALTALLVRPGAALDDDLLHLACETLRERFGIAHATLQVEDGLGGVVCALRSDEVV